MSKVFIINMYEEEVILEPTHHLHKLSVVNTKKCYRILAISTRDGPSGAMTAIQRYLVPRKARKRALRQNKDDVTLTLNSRRPFLTQLLLAYLMIIKGVVLTTGAPATAL